MWLEIDNVKIVVSDRESDDDEIYVITALPSPKAQWNSLLTFRFYTSHGQGLGYVKHNFDNYFNIYINNILVENDPE